MYAPDRVITNEELSGRMDTSDEWITSRTGIKERRVAAPHESTATMALRAAQDALQVAGVAPQDLDLIIVATLTKDYLFPATACLVQDALGATRAAAFDLEAGCSGFVYALGVASQMIKGGAYERVLVIGSETLSRFLDWNDRHTAVLFGDGAGAFVVQAGEVPGGVLSFVLGSDGSGASLLMIEGGGARHPPTLETVTNGMHQVSMNGREVFKFAARAMTRSAQQAIATANLRPQDIDLFIPHQANLRIIKASAKDLDIPMERVFVNVDQYGNTSSASVPIAFCEAIQQERLRPGDIVVLVGFGAGLTWAASVVQWAVPLPAPQPSSWYQLRRSVGYRRARLRSRTRRLWRRLDSLWTRLTRRDL